MGDGEWGAGLNEKKANSASNKAGAWSEFGKNTTFTKGNFFWDAFTKTVWIDNNCKYAIGEIRQHKIFTKSKNGSLCFIYQTLG